MNLNYLKHMDQIFVIIDYLDVNHMDQFFIEINEIIDFNSIINIDSFNFLHVNLNFNLDFSYACYYNIDYVFII